MGVPSLSEAWRWFWFEIYLEVWVDSFAKQNWYLYSFGQPDYRGLASASLRRAFCMNSGFENGLDLITWKHLIKTRLTSDQFQVMTSCNAAKMGSVLEVNSTKAYGVEKVWKPRYERKKCTTWCQRLSRELSTIEIVPNREFQSSHKLFTGIALSVITLNLFSEVSKFSNYLRKRWSSPFMVKPSLAQEFAAEVPLLVREFIA